MTKPKRSPWKWILGVLAVLALLCGGGFAACTVLVGKGVNDAVNDINAEEKAKADANKKTCEGKTYPDQQPDNDRCADASGAVTLDGVLVTAKPLARNKAALCTTVSYKNSGTKTVSFNTFDWKLQVPTGEVKDAFDTGLTGTATTTLGSGDLVAGGSKTGTICYEAPGAGQFIVIYKPTFLDRRGIWINDL